MYQKCKSNEQITSEMQNDAIINKVKDYQVKKKNNKNPSVIFLNQVSKTHKGQEWSLHFISGIFEISFSSIIDFSEVILN